MQFSTYNSTKPSFNPSSYDSNTYTMKVLSSVGLVFSLFAISIAAANTCYDFWCANGAPPCGACSSGLSKVENGKTINDCGGCSASSGGTPSSNGYPC
ncbi:hypothetical protein FACUT_14200 [Fusarium acutatum]|uniref:Uncharacterized protein n=1 Tax=Fusarium acutatum TaxID=78861 RepID=A0A8H4JAD3_9HYPO|nr:hypothetical protein FACUT_14200 [Fusarium acutatum]